MQQGLSIKTKRIIKWVWFSLYCVFFIFMVALNLFVTRKFQVLSLLLFSIPAILLWLSIKGKIKKVAVVLALLFIPAFTGLFMLGRDAMEQIRSPALYRRVLRLYNYPENESLAHFPAEIPAGKKQVQFREWPAFLQAGGYICLCYEADLAEWEALYKSQADKVDWSLTYGGSVKPAFSTGPHSPDGYFFPVDFSNEYTIFFFSEKQDYVNYGIAYSHSDELLLYFCNYGL